MTYLLSSVLGIFGFWLLMIIEVLRSPDESAASPFMHRYYLWANGYRKYYRLVPWLEAGPAILIFWIPLIAFLVMIYSLRAYFSYFTAT